MALRRVKVILDLDFTSMYAALYEARRATIALLRMRDNGPCAYNDGGPPYRWHGDDS